MRSLKVLRPKIEILWKFIFSYFYLRSLLLLHFLNYVIIKTWFVYFLTCNIMKSKKKNRQINWNMISLNKKKNLEDLTWISTELSHLLVGGAKFFFEGFIFHYHKFLNTVKHFLNWKNKSSGGPVNQGLYFLYM